MMNRVAYAWYCVTMTSAENLQILHQEFDACDVNVSLFVAEVIHLI